MEEPQTNGVVERFNKTLNDKVIYGKVFRSPYVTRQAVTEFFDNYNRAIGG